jgi:hypothetical protein
LRRYLNEIFLYSLTVLSNNIPIIDDSQAVGSIAVAGSQSRKSVRAATRAPIILHHQRLGSSAAPFVASSSTRDRQSACELFPALGSALEGSKEK